MAPVRRKKASRPAPTGPTKERSCAGKLPSPSHSPSLLPLVFITSLVLVTDATLSLFTLASLPTTQVALQWW